MPRGRVVYVSYIEVPYGTMYPYRRKGDAESVDAANSNDPNTYVEM
jgi:hypothetical protein